MRRGRATRLRCRWSQETLDPDLVQEVAGSNLGLGQLATGKLSLSTQQQMNIFSESGKDKAVKGEGWAPPLICCA